MREKCRTKRRAPPADSSSAPSSVDRSEGVVRGVCKDEHGRKVNGAMQQVEKGNEHFNAQRWSHAIQCYELAVAQDPMMMTAAVNVGLVYAAQNKWAEALAACEPLQQRFHGYGMLDYCLGLGYMHTNRFTDAVALLLSAGRAPDGPQHNLDPALGEAYGGLAHQLLERGQPSEAKHAAESAVQFLGDTPAAARPTKTLGFALRQLGLHEAALGAFEHAAALSPRDPEVWANLGLVQSHLGRGQAAVDSFYKGIELYPRFVGAYAALGKHHQALHHTKEAIDAFEKGLSIDGDNAALHAGIMQAIADACAWDKKERYLPKVLSSMQREVQAALQHAAAGAPRPAVAPFDAILGVPTPPLWVRQLAEAYTAVAKEEVKRAGMKVPKPSPKRPKRGQKLRVGYFSSDFGNTPVGRLMASVPLLHSHAAAVAPAVYALNARDGSYYRELVEQGATVVPLVGLSNEAAAQKVAEDGVHILVEMLGFTAGAYAMAREHIMAMAPAPITVGFLGYPGTMGTPNNHNASKYYSVVDRVIVAPDMTSHFSEKLLYMPHSYQVNNLRMVEERAPEGLATRASERLPEESFVFAHFNTLRKVDAVVFSVWMNILSRVPRSVLWLLAMPAEAVAALTAEAQSRGVHASRLVFGDPTSPESHLRRCGLADLMLDSLHYNAHTTATDALWAGVPIVTLPGEMMQSRVAAGLIEAVGLPELIVDSLKEYEELVVALATGQTGDRPMEASRARL